MNFIMKFGFCRTYIIPEFVLTQELLYTLRIRPQRVFLHLRPAQYRCGPVQHLLRLRPLHRRLPVLRVPEGAIERTLLGCPITDDCRGGFRVADTIVSSHIHKHHHFLTHTHDGSTHTHEIIHAHGHNHYVTDKRHVHQHSGQELEKELDQQ